MPRICEVCGRTEETENEATNKYEILDVCPECSEHLIHPTAEMEND